MTLKITLWVFLTFLATFSVSQDICSEACETQVYQNYDSSGTSYVYNCYQSNLALVAFDNQICSSKQTGMWIYYENINYNANEAGSVAWVHGIEYSSNFPVNNCGTTSSLRVAGNRKVLNENSYTLYDGTSFTGADFYGTTDLPDMLTFNNRTSSLIVTGILPWTFYTKTDYKGSAFCYQPSTDVDESDDGGTFANYGTFQTLEGGGIQDNSFRSVKQGCFTSAIAKNKKLPTISSSKNGAWGILDS